MKFAKSYIQGLGEVIKSQGLWLFFYGVLSLFGLLIILPIHGMILEHLGFPLDIGRDLGKFDYTQIADLLNNHGEALGIVFYQAKWIVLFYLLVSVLLTSGVVSYFLSGKNKFVFSEFIKYANQNFRKFLRLTIYFVLIHLLIIGLFLYFYQSYIGSFSPFEIEDDSRLVSGFWILTPIYLFLALLIHVISDVAKFNIVKSGKSFITQAIIDAINFVVKNIFSFLLFYLLHILFFIIVSKLYLLLKSVFTLESGLGFWILIILGQLYIYAKLGLRLVKYAGLNKLLKE